MPDDLLTQAINSMHLFNGEMTIVMELLQRACRNLDLENKIEEELKNVPDYPYKGNMHNNQTTKRGPIAHAQINLLEKLALQQGNTINQLQNTINQLQTPKPPQEPSTTELANALWKRSETKIIIFMFLSLMVLFFALIITHSRLEYTSDHREVMGITINFPILGMVWGDFH